MEEKSDKYKEIADELIKMGLADQKMRRDYQNPTIKTEWDAGVDIGNRERLREIINEIGWPTIDKVGEVASYAAFLIAQHADLDPDFQEECLLLMEEAVKENQVDKVSVAFLTDRVEVNRGREQIYGTQFHPDESGNPTPRPIKDKKHLDERRKEMGMEPFSVVREREISLMNKLKQEHPQFTEEELKPPMIGGLFYKLR